MTQRFSICPKADSWLGVQPGSIQSWQGGWGDPQTQQATLGAWAGAGFPCGTWPGREGGQLNKLGLCQAGKGAGDQRMLEQAASTAILVFKCHLPGTSRLVLVNSHQGCWNVCLLGFLRKRTFLQFALFLESDLLFPNLLPLLQFRPLLPLVHLKKKISYLVFLPPILLKSKPFSILLAEQSS